MTKTVIILNGPPGAGKDTLADLMVAKGIAQAKLSFKTPMFKIAEKLLSESFGLFMRGYNDRKHKEQPVEWLGNISRREYMIWISETLCKPVFGDDCFGVALTNSVKEDISVVADGGFESEIKPLADAGHRVILVRLHRDGYSFKGDSRDYLSGRYCADAYDIHLVDGDPEGALRIIQTHIG